MSLLNELKERSIYDVNNKIKLKVLPQNEKWKVNTIKELTDVKQNKLFISDDNSETFFTRKEIDVILADIATLFYEAFPYLTLLETV